MATLYNASLNKGMFISRSRYHFFSKLGLLGQYVLHELTCCQWNLVFWNLHTASHNRHSFLDSHQQCTGFPFCYHQNLQFFFFDFLKVNHPDLGHWQNAQICRLVLNQTHNCGFHALAQPPPTSDWLCMEQQKCQAKKQTWPQLRQKSGKGQSIWMTRGGVTSEMLRKDPLRKNDLEAPTWLSWGGAMSEWFRVHQQKI